MGKYNIGAVVAEFNFDINQSMLGLAKEEAKSRGSEITKVFIAPGVFDMALPIKKLLERDDIDAVVALGSVIEGATDHDQIVAQHAARKITDLSLDYDKPVTLGISGPGMTRLDAHKRIDYGKKAVEAAIKLLDRLEELEEE
ncbi:MAG: 6,7-dimethyl-8-ribityllumazine synthase [Methanobrevibacter boviskoreani]|jgi:6,7-dimethyl-8-ribityllumazine synthase|uniref:6,7-dimethyl-8-ribityllumazine synthase n=1 Tax=Methanobrevibacter TaxID=2172 RepID=UPI0003348E44|nr:MULTISPECIES: 6,7-dimethyl-8-ribityllumazine synthase [Methanobrevibacter]AGN17570.1 6,7-dimethyl-8- ribityllumazine synthase RibH [Methanobrevibacter sp. AbM4]MCI6774105.1 6,7-dimethyl-8-ribityllumazine synthase [Methanobrevibacter boviskoreani]MCI6929725.1 6,7-dimethyl-8-ribityllumazine synthase [Methanobrevibacter boviskoreani]